jgi:hypothetical protein
MSEMMIAAAPNDIGCDIDAVAAGASTDAHIFSEFAGIVVEIPDDEFAAFESLAKKNGAPCQVLGRTTSEPKLTVTLIGGVLDVPLSGLREAVFEGRFNQLFA